MEQCDEETLAKLLLSVGTRKKWRALDRITTAKILESMCRSSSQAEVARKLSVSPETIREFRSLLKLPESIQKLIKAGKIGLDAGYRIFLMESKDEQEILAEAIAEKRIKMKEWRGIIQSLKKRNPQMPISECIELAIKYRPIIEEEHLVVTSLQRDTLNALKKKSEANGILINDLMKRILTKIMPSTKDMIMVKIIDGAVLLALKKDGFKALQLEAQKLKVKLDNLIEVLMKEWLEKR